MDFQYLMCPTMSHHLLDMAHTYPTSWEFSATIALDGRNIQTFSDTTPSPPKFNVYVTWGALAQKDERNQTLNITVANMCAETLRFWGVGVQHSVCCRVWIFRPSTVSPLDVSTFLKSIQIPTVETSVCMLLILFQTARSIAFSQVNATCLSPVSCPILSCPWCATYCKICKAVPCHK